MEAKYPTPAAPRDVKIPEYGFGAMFLIAAIANFVMVAWPKFMSLYVP